MGAFQKLLDEVYGVARLTKRQQEMDELQKAAAKRFLMESEAQAKFKAPEGGLRLYHGTPFDFERFDFENNLMKGEGALAYGPGGYMTGNEPLARQYAKDLFSRHSGAGQYTDPYTSRPTRQALMTDPKAAAQYLRAVQVGKILDAGGQEGSKSFDLSSRNAMPPHMAGRAPNYVAYPKRTIPGDWTSPVSRVQRPDTYALGSESTLSGLDDYVRLAESAGLPPQRQPYRIGQGGISPLEVIRRGKELERVMGGNPGIRPRIQERLSYLEGPLYGREEAAQRLNDLRGDSPKFEMPGLGHNRANLNSTWRFLNDRPGNAGYTAHMGKNARIDLRNPAVPDWPTSPTEGSALARRLYEAPYQGALEDMIPYDYPVKFAGPKATGALTMLADKYGFLDELHPDMLGKDAMRLVQSKVGRDPLKQMQAFRDAGIPGHYFLRGGRRDPSVIPDQFQPDDYNYVIFDQNTVGTPKKTEFNVGGSVHAR